MDVSRWEVQSTTVFTVQTLPKNHHELLDSSGKKWIIVQKIIGLVIYDLLRRQGDVWLTQFGLLKVAFSGAFIKVYNAK